MIIIPARLASTRFPQKILADINGLPMVVRTAQNAAQNDDVCVACDDESVLSLCKRYKIPAVLTSKHHQSGTDRCNEAAKILSLAPSEIIINIQADEPFLESGVIKALQEKMAQGVWMGSCAKILEPKYIDDPNIVKVVLNKNNEAVYFSRSVIPYCRDKEGVESVKYYGHLGVYGYSTKSLGEFCSLPAGVLDSPLEHIEKLEQLRALYYGKKIAMVLVQSTSLGIDTPKDLEYALQHFV